MVLVRLLVPSLFLMSLVESQPTQSSHQASSPPHPAGEQSPLGTDNLSFPWSRLRLPRYACSEGIFPEKLPFSFGFIDCESKICLCLRYIIPLHYHLLLHPNLTSLRFTGSVQIQIDVQNNTNWVVLHSKGLQISKATIVDQNLAPPSDKVVVNAAQQLLTFVCYLLPTVNLTPLHLLWF